MEQLCRLLFISLLFVSACAGGGSPSRCLLERADSLLDVRPDSALRRVAPVARGFAPSVGRQGRADALRPAADAGQV